MISTPAAAMARAAQVVSRREVGWEGTRPPAAAGRDRSPHVPGCRDQVDAAGHRPDVLERLRRTARRDSATAEGEGVFGHSLAVRALQPDRAAKACDRVHDEPDPSHSVTGPSL
jgi:hypothetical protein